MTSPKSQNPADATSLRVPIILLDLYPADTKSPADFACELKRQLKVARVPVMQVHMQRADMVHQLDARSESFGAELEALVHALADCGSEFFVIGLQNTIPCAEISNVFSELASDTFHTVHTRGYRTRCAGVSELRLMLEIGAAAERIDLALHVHRRGEIAETVAELLRLDPRQYPEMLPIQKAAADVLVMIDELAAAHVKAA